MSKKKLRTVLVTGGSGFIGRHVVSRLRADGLQVLVLDTKADPQLSVATGVHVYLADVRDQGAVDAAVEHTDAVIHLAGLRGVPQPVVDVNVRGALNVLEAAHRFERPIVMTSRSGAERFVDPDSIAARTVESFTEMYQQQFDLPANIVRLGESYGPVPWGAQESRGLVAKLVQRALHGEELPVDENEFVTPMHVRDVADVLVDTMWYAFEVGTLPGPIDLGGREYGAVDVATEISQAVSTLTGAISTIRVEEHESFLDAPVADPAGLDILYPEGRTMIAFKDGLPETVEQAARYAS